MIPQHLRPLMDQAILTGQQVTAGIRSVRVTQDQQRIYNAYILGRCLTTFDAVELLCEGGYGTDAFCLARGIFEDAVRLRYTNRQPESRLPLFHLRGLKNEMRAVNELKKIFGSKKIEEFLPPGHVDQVKSALAEIRSVCGKAESEPSVLDMAIDVGLEGMFMPMYFAASDYTHSGVMSYRSYVRASGPDAVEFRAGPDHGDPRIPSAIYACCISCSVVFIEVMGVFGILLDPARASNAIRTMNDQFREYTLGNYRAKSGGLASPTP